ncbi:hypothetical protein PoB_005724800 [Plakobranchus ocellatus]|uniref:Uncharacterized protein n=1 Tax=Plakobranchus ocellatus TaxID=259542 RepID=A0AAV4CFL8_9GAST|nr:hypothetical protein PoB_005724800 [Plakobranchus ocellatus]
MGKFGFCIVSPEQSGLRLLGPQSGRDIGEGIGSGREEKKQKKNRTLSRNKSVRKEVRKRKKRIIKGRKSSKRGTRRRKRRMPVYHLVFQACRLAGSKPAKDIFAVTGAQLSATQNPSE